MRTKEFNVVMFVSNGVLPEYEPSIRNSLQAIVERPFDGPRGGRYIPFGPTVIDSAPDGERWDRNQTVFRARRMGKYVRPKH